MRRLVPIFLCAALAACGAPITGASENTDAEMNSMDETTAMDAVDDDGIASNDVMMPHPSERDVAPAGEIPYCEAIDAFIDAAECRRMEVQKARLGHGIAAFAPPQKMVVGEAQDLTLAIGDKDQAGDEDDLDTKIGDALGNAAAPVRVKVKVGRFMKATLSGSSFTIRPLSDEAKDLGASRFATWQWRVTPTEAGARTMLLKVEADAIGSDGKQTTLELASKSVTIAVGVSKAQKYTDRMTATQKTMDETTTTLGSLKNLLLALGAVIIAGGAVYAALRGRGGKPPDAPADPE